MKTHGPNSPQSIRGLRERRSLRGLLDTRRMAEADLRVAEYVGAFGKGFHTVKNPGGGDSYIVADQTGGRTFAPGTSILLGSPTGLPGEAVLGGAPAGKKGGRSTTRNPRRRGTVAVGSNQYAFGFDGLGAMVACLYSEGTYVSTRATATQAGDFTGCILTDSSLLVGDGSALLKDSSDLAVWDVENTTVHSYSVPAGWTNPTNLYYQNGFLYWCEIEDISGDTTFDVRLRKADTDLGNVSTLATYTSPDAVGDYGAPWIVWFVTARPLAFAVDADAAILYVESQVSDVSNATDWHGLQIRFLLSGSSSFREFDTPELGVDGINLLTPPNDFPCATVGTTSFAIAEPIDTVQSVLSKVDDASTPAAALWGASDLDSIPVSSFHVALDGSTLQVHSASAEKILRGVGAPAVVASSILPFDNTPNYPAAMFYFGGV